MLEREWRSVHRDGKHRIPAVHGDLGGCSDRHPVGRPRHDLRGARLHAGVVQDGLQGGPDPPRVPDVAPADLVRHAVERDVALDERPRDEIGEGERDRVIDHAVDLQLPILELDLRHQQRRVDPVEVLARCGERADAGNAELGACGQRSRGARRRRDLERGATGLREATLLPVAGETARERGRGPERRGRLQEPTAIEPGRRFGFQPLTGRAGGAG